MKEVLKSELYRNLLHIRIAFGILGIFLTVALSNVEDLYNCLENNSGSVLYIFEMVTNGGWFFSIIYLFAAFTSSTGFCEDINNRYFYAIMIRTKGIYYSVSKMISCVLGAMTIVFCGAGLFLIASSVFLPVIRKPEEISGITMLPYRVLLLENKVYAYFVIKILLISISVSFWSCVGILVSTVNPDKFLAISSPFVLNYIVSRLQLYMPDYLNLDYMACGYPILGDNAGWLCTLIYSIGVYFVLTLLLIYIFHRKVQGYADGKNYCESF